MEPWNLLIERVDNGYAVHGTDLNIVLQDNEGDPLASHTEMLYEVMEYFNFQGSKHDAERLRVIREQREE